MSRVIKSVVSDEIGVVGFQSLGFRVTVGTSSRLLYQEFFEGASNYLEPAWKRLGF